LRDRFRAAAKAFFGCFNGDVALLAPGETGDGEGNVEPGYDAVRSEEAESVRPPMGTVRLFRFDAEASGDS